MTTGAFPCAGCEGYHVHYGQKEVGVMRATEVRWFLIEIDRIRRRQDALRELLDMRVSTLRESLRQRIRRAHREGQWLSLTPKECAVLYQQERSRLQEQVQRLREEHKETTARLRKLERAKLRAERARAAEMARHKRLLNVKRNRKGLKTHAQKSQAPSC